METQTIVTDPAEAKTPSPRVAPSGGTCKMFVLARRELANYFLSPLGYLLCALVVFCEGYYYFECLRSNNEASLRDLFVGMGIAMVFVVPLLTMRLMSEEFRSGTIECLMTAPVTDFDVIMGKFLGTMGFYLVLLASTLLLMAFVMVYGQPDLGVAAMGYLGMILLGMAFVSVGLLASTISPHQLISAVVAFAILGVFTFGMGMIVERAIEPWSHLAQYLSVKAQIERFASGVFDTRSLVYFLSATVLFLFMSVKVLESRRWR